MKQKLKWLLIVFIPILFMGQNEEDCHRNADHETSIQQERMMREANAQAGLPAIANFQEKKLMKMVYEMRDQENLSTWVYLQSEQTGRLIFLGRGVGFGIPYAAQYTSPTAYGNGRPQAEPNGLFMPSSAEGTWVLMVDRRTNKARPVYIEPRVVISPFPLDNNE